MSEFVPAIGSAPYHKTQYILLMDGLFSYCLQTPWMSCRPCNLLLQSLACYLTVLQSRLQNLRLLQISLASFMHTSRAMMKPYPPSASSQRWTTAPYSNSHWQKWYSSLFYNRMLNRWCPMQCRQLVKADWIERVLSECLPAQSWLTVNQRLIVIGPTTTTTTTSMDFLWIVRQISVQGSISLFSELLLARPFLFIATFS